MVIVGGGLAGSAAALTLAKSGVGAILLEREATLAKKLCGEFLSSTSVRWLHALGAGQILEEEGAVKIPTWVLATSRRSIERKFREPGFALSRLRLDPALRREARRNGVDVREGWRAVRADRTGETWRVQLKSSTGEVDELLTPFIVFAAGRSAKVPGLTEEISECSTARGDRSRSEGDPGSRGAVVRGAMAFKAHVQPRPGCELRALLPQVGLYVLPDAYLGTVPAEDGALNVCFLLRGERFRRGMDPTQFLDRCAKVSAPFRTLWDCLEVHDIPWIAVAGLDFTRRPSPQPNVFFAGDAAAVLPPLLGEGMAIALETGHAAGCAATARGAPVFAPGKGRLRLPGSFAVDRGRFVWGRVLQSILLGRRRSEWLGELLNVVPALGDFVVQATRGKPARS